MIRQLEMEFPGRRSALRCSEWDEEIIVDLFAGGGGASVGIEQALGRAVDVAVNHDPMAVRMHALNHPATRHLCESIFEVDPREATRGRRVGLLWASPDCTHFSRARGGKPVSKNIRCLAWCVCKWAESVKPRVIVMENVREFQDWGPLIPKLDKRGRPMLAPPDMKDWIAEKPATRTKAEYRRLKKRGKLLKTRRVMIPCPKRKGQTFRRFVNRLKKLNYRVEWRVQNAADFGAPTHRRRLFLIARRDGKAIQWPEATHGPKEVVGDIGSSRQSGIGARQHQGDQHSGGRGRLSRSSRNDRADARRDTAKRRLLPYNVAADCIDWSIPIHSIFLSKEEGKRLGVKRPLVENSMKRIARGTWRYVIDNPRPFLVRVNHGGDRSASESIDEPIGTMTAKNGFALATPHITAAPYISKHNGDQVGQPVDEPWPTIVHKPTQNTIVAPVLSQICNTGGNGKYTRGIEEPLGTIVSKNQDVLSCPLFTHYYGDDKADSVRASSLDEPIAVIPTENRFSIACPLLSLFNGEPPDGAIRADAIDQPAATITTANRFTLVSAWCMQYFGGRTGKPLEEPLPCITACDHNAVSACFLTKHFGGERATTGTVSKGIDDPLPCITARDHNAITGCFISKQFGTSTGQPIDEPSPTNLQSRHTGVAACFMMHSRHGDKQEFPCDEPERTVTAVKTAHLVAAFLMKYYGPSIGQEADIPLHTATAKPRFAVITVEKDQYLIYDIGARMLVPRELARCQG